MRAKLIYVLATKAPKWALHATIRNMTNNTKSQTASTVLIVFGAILIAFGAMHLFTAPAVIADAANGGPEIAGKVVGVLLFIGLGTYALIVGINKRKTD